MKKLLVAVLSPVVLSTLVSAQTPGGAVRTTNEHGQAESVKPAPAPAAGKPAQSGRRAAPALVIPEPREGELDKQVPIPVPTLLRQPHDQSPDHKGRNRGAMLALLVSILSSQGNTERAKVLAEEALPLLASPYSAEEFYYRGMVHHALGNYDLATADFDKALQLKPGLWNVYEFWGGVYLRKGDYDRAIAEYDKVIQSNPEYSPAYYERGVAYSRKGEYDRAIADFDTAMRLHPPGAYMYYERGIAYFAKRDFDRAIADYSEGIRLIPIKKGTREYGWRATNYYYVRGVAYAQKGDYKGAIADFDTAIQLHSQNVLAYHRRGRAYSDQGDYKRAIADYSEAIRLNPDYIEAYNNRAAAYEKVGDKARAQADRDKTAELEKQGRKP